MYYIMWSVYCYFLSSSVYLYISLSAMLLSNADDSTKHLTPLVTKANLLDPQMDTIQTLFSHSTLSVHFRLGFGHILRNCAHYKFTYYYYCMHK